MLWLPVPSSASFFLSCWQPLWPPWPSRLPLVSFEVPFRSRVSPKQEKANHKTEAMAILARFIFQIELITFEIILSKT
jgi:hypothetical protein